MTRMYYEAARGFNFNLEFVFLKALTNSSQIIWALEFSFAVLIEMLELNTVSRYKIP